MSGLVEKIKHKISPHKEQEQEQVVSIQPHPAKSNNPAELEGPQVGAGLTSNPEVQAHHARDPHVPSQAIKDNLDEPLDRETLRARAAELNE